MEESLIIMAWHGAGEGWCDRIELFKAVVQRNRLNIGQLFAEQLSSVAEAICKFNHIKR